MYLEVALLYINSPKFIICLIPLKQSLKNLCHDITLTITRITRDSQNGAKVLHITPNCDRFVQCASRNVIVLQISLHITYLDLNTI